MRIISGTYRGRKLHPPNNLPVRPTTDMAREALFNILTNYFDFEESRVLDLFCGTGAVSMEFVSRGSVDVMAVDLNAHCLDFINRTIENWKMQGLRTMKADVFRFLEMAKVPWDIIFADPPFDMKENVLIPDLVFNNKLLSPEGWLVVEHSPEVGFAKHPFFIERRSYGRVQFSIFGHKENADSGSDTIEADLSSIQ